MQQLLPRGLQLLKPQKLLLPPPPPLLLPPARLAAAPPSGLFVEPNFITWHCLPGSHRISLASCFFETWARLI